MKCMVMYSLLCMFFFPVSLYAENKYENIMNRFVSGAVKTHGSIQDRLIEGAIEASTPDADESVRRVQRAAVKYALSSDRKDSQKYWDEVNEGLKDIVQRRSIVDTEKTAMAHEESPQDSKCRIVNYGKPPGEIEVLDGCFTRDCPEIQGVFTVNMGWGVSGLGEGMMWPIDMEVTLHGDRATLYESGFQTLRWFENVTVKRVGDIVMFGHDERTTVANGSQELRESVSGHPFLGVQGEYFSLLLPPDNGRRAIVHFGILDPEDVLVRVCE